jgi:hypothetical protein
VQHFFKNAAEVEEERKRPLSLISALIELNLENIPVEHFQRVNKLKLISIGLCAKHILPEIRVVD